ncbi:MAG: PDZ domain-containing protein [Myxococcales bacterium]|nr:PDZ domain-containing protein [Myxococcales bacterium]
MKSMPEQLYTVWLRATSIILVVAGTACAQTTRQAEAASLPCNALSKLFAQYQAYHYSIGNITPELKHRTAEQFVQSIDPSRTLLLKSEAEGLTTRIEKHFDTIAQGNCELLSEAFGIIQNKATEDTLHAQKLMTDSYKVDTSVKIVIDPDERGYALSTVQRSQLVESLIHFQMANYLRGSVAMDKAKKQLVHRYQLVEKRLAERAKKQRLPEIFAEAFARSLDPHTSYLSHDSLVDFQINMKLSLEGIGAALRSSDGFTYIESLIPGGGAEKSGKLRPKDKIIAVSQDGEAPVTTIDMSIQDVVKLIRGKKGTKVTLSILREGTETKTFGVTIVRDKIDVKQQAAKIEFEERTRNNKKFKVGVLELPSFYGGGDRDGRSSYLDVKHLLEEAKAKSADTLVLDLSKNGGGYLEDAVRISGLFIREGAIVATRDTGGEVSILKDTDSSISWSGPLVVLISPLSASASEILAGALQSYQRALVVGAATSSFGKGSVQTLRPLPGNLGAVKVTTGMYFLPNGRSTQQVGVSADLVVPSLLSTVEMGEKDLDYSLPPQSTQEFRSLHVNKANKDHWTPVSLTATERLIRRSKARISTSEAYAEIHAEIEKAEKRKGIVDLTDFAEEQKKKKDESTEEQEDDDQRFERLEKTFVNEAIEIAVDLAIAPRGPSLGANKQRLQQKEGPRAVTRP